MGIVLDEMVKNDIFEKKVRERADTLWKALYDRRGYYNTQKKRLLDKSYKQKHTQSYKDALNAVKDTIVYLTIRINKLSVMKEKNIFDEDILDMIETEYKQQV